MTSTLIVKDLSNATDLDDKAMSAVRGGTSDQANGTNQGNTLAAFAPMAVANGSCFGGGPVNIQATNNVCQDAHNDSWSANYKDYALDASVPGCEPPSYPTC